MSGWDFDKKGNGTSSSDGEKVKWTKFPEGITRIRPLDTVPNVRWTHWINKFQRSINCPGKGCPICEIRKQEKANKLTHTYAVGQRFALNVYNYDTESIELMEQGKTFFQDLRDFHNELEKTGSDITQAIFKIRRRGTGKDDTTYRVDLDKEADMEKEVKALSAKRIDLDDYFKPHTPEQILKVINAKPNGKDDANKIWGEIMQNESSEDKTTETPDEDVELN